MISGNLDILEETGTIIGVQSQSLTILARPNTLRSS
jgi:hypothetical protein